MNKKLLLLPALLIFSLFINNSSIAQRNAGNLFEITQGDYTGISEKVSNAQLLQLNKEAFDEIFTEKPYKISINVPIENGIFANVVLEKFDILTSDAIGIEKSPTGDKVFDLRNLIVSYTGKVSGIENSFVSINFSINGVNGTMTTSHDRYVISKQYKAADNRYVLYKESNLKIQSDFHCETSDDVPQEIQHMMNNLTGDYQGGGDIRVANLALDFDQVTYNRYGTVQNTTAYGLSLISSVSALYTREMNVKLNVSYVNVWTTADPYTGTTSNQILNQFRSYWNSNQQGVSRTLAHLISTRSAGLGGIAWVGVLCANVSSGNGYGFSNTNGFFNQLPTYSWDVDVVAHELGHNFGSPHTHSCSWPGGPIDSCYSVEGNCYNGPAIPITGTIMSYCHLTSGGKFLEFGPLPRQLIRLNAQNAPCMTDLPSSLLLAYPNGGEVFRTFTNAYIIWGSSFTGNVNIELSTNDGSTWSTIASNLPSSDNGYSWTVPNIDTTLQARIRIYNSSNSAMGDTTDQVFSIYKNLTMAGLALNSPPTFTKVFTSPGDTSSYRFDWRKAGFHESIRYKWSIKKIGSTAEYFVESDNNGADTSLTVTRSFLDSLARANFGLTNDTVACLWRAWSYNGYDSLSSNLFIITIADESVGINNISQEIPKEFKLFNNYPNPFNPSTKIRFDVPEQSYVNLKIYDCLGREITQLVNESMSAGTYEVDFNTSLLGNLPSGVYFYRIQTSGNNGAFVDTKRMILVK